MEVGGFFEFPLFDCRGNKDSVYYYLTNTYKNGKHSFFMDSRQSMISVLLSIKDLNNKICYLPAYLCDSILQPFEEFNLSIIFYKHCPPLKPVIETNIEKSLIYVIDHFGSEAISEDEIYHFLRKGNIVILDLTHFIFNKSSYRMSHNNLYIVSSLRKIFPISDDAVLYHNNTTFKINNFFQKDYGKMLEAMFLKSSYRDN